MNHTFAYYIDYFKSIENTAKKLRKTFELRKDEVFIIGVWIDDDLKFIQEKLDECWYHYISCRCEEVEEREDK